MPFAFPPNGARPPRGCWITKVDNNGACHSISFHGDHTVSPCSDTTRVITEHLQAGTNCCVSAGVLCQRSGKLPTQHKYQSRLIICCSSQHAGMWSKFTYNGLMWACCSSLCQCRSWWWGFFLHATNTAYYSFPCKRSLANAVFPVLSKQPSKTQR